MSDIAICHLFTEMDFFTALFADEDMFRFLMQKDIVVVESETTQVLFVLVLLALVARFSQTIWLLGYMTTVLYCVKHVENVYMWTPQGRLLLFKPALQTAGLAAAAWLGAQHARISRTTVLIVTAVALLLSMKIEV